MTTGDPALSGGAHQQSFGGWLEFGWYLVVGFGLFLVASLAIATAFDHTIFSCSSSGTFSKHLANDSIECGQIESWWG